MNLVTKSEVHVAALLVKIGERFLNTVNELEA